MHEMHFELSKPRIEMAVTTDSPEAEVRAKRLVQGFLAKTDRGVFRESCLCAFQGLPSSSQHDRMQSNLETCRTLLEHVYHFNTNAAMVDGTLPAPGEAWEPQQKLKRARQLGH
jgi:hypothetical protein